jgi:predicted ribosome quality control (RQC) complex YloA/Tae2 family protein
MNLHYFTLSRLTEALHEKIAAAVIMDVFSSSKEELWFHFFRDDKNFLMKITFAAGQAFFNFYDDDRTGKNNQPAFRELKGEQVTAVVQHFADRSFRIETASGYKMLFKLYGAHSNVILFRDGVLLQAFRKQFVKDRELKLENFKSAAGKLRTDDLSAILPEIPEAVLQPGREVLESEEKLLEYLQHPRFYIGEPRGENDAYSFSLFKVHEDDKPYEEMLDALDSFSRLFLNRWYYQHEKKKLLAGLTEKRIKLRRLIDNTRRKLDHRNSLSYEQMGHQIMANLHNLKEGDVHADCSDFNTGAPVRIKLNPRLSPQDNAAHYYRKGKNEFIERQKLEVKVTTLQAELEALEKELLTVEKAESYRELKSFRKEAVVNKETAERLSYREYEIEGFKVLVGRSAADNDELTLHVARKNDLWLHAKDVSGSHVIIRHQSGKNYPRTVIEKAAALAAFHSRRKTDTLCPVVYTEKKYVRKPKGSNPGSVVVEREQVLMVKPAALQTS